MAANPFDEFDKQSGANPFDEFDTPVKQREFKPAQDFKNLAAGAVRGAGSIGATIVSPWDIANDALSGKGLSLDSNRERRANIDYGLRNGFLFGMEAEPDSLFYQGGKLAGEVAGVSGVPGIVAKGVQGLGAAPSLVNAISSGGFRLGTPPATTKLGILREALLRAGGGAVAGASVAGAVNPQDAGTGAVIGGAMPGAVQVAGKLGQGARGLLANTLGATTGTSRETVGAAYDAGKTGAKAFADNMRGNAEFDDVVQAAKDGLARMRADRGAQYRSGMMDISMDKTVLDFTPIDSAMSRVSSLGNYKGVQTNKNAAGTVQELADTVAQWKALDPKEYHTPEGLDALKRAVGDIRDSTQFGTPARVAADQVYNAIKSEITKQAPIYSKVMSDYTKASKDLDEITRALSLGDKASKDTAIRKLHSLMRNNAQTNYGNRLSLAQQLEQQGGVSLTPAIAGQSMNTWTPRGMTGAIEKAGLAALGGASLMNPSLLMATLAAPIASPRTIGELAYALGRASGGASKAAANVARITPPNARMLAEGAARVSPVIGLADLAGQR